VAHVTDWESRIHRTPDTVSVTDVFEDVLSGETRRQYEGAVGLYWLADLRPTRLLPRWTDLRDLLGSTPDVSLGDSGGCRTRDWVSKAVGNCLRAFPELAPDVLETAKSGEHRTREDAISAFARSVSKIEHLDRELPPPLAVRLSEQYDWLAEEYRSNTNVASDALVTIVGMIPWYDERVRELTPLVMSRFGHEGTSLVELSFLREAAIHSGELRPDVVASFLDHLEHTDVEGQAHVLQSLARIVEQNSETGERITRELDESTVSDREPAQLALDRLDSNLIHEP
jgi:hypothetical protein